MQKTCNNLTFVTDILLRFFQKNLQICEHKCHLAKSQSQKMHEMHEPLTRHALTKRDTFSAIFLLQVC